MAAQDTTDPFMQVITQLRSKMLEARNAGVANPDVFEASIIQMISDAEKAKRGIVQNIQNYKNQIALWEGQLQGLSSISSLVYNAFNGYVTQAIKQVNEEADEAAREKEAEAERAELIRQEEAKKKVEQEVLMAAAPVVIDSSRQPRKK
jgi:cellobiose-specific phosphotransferase system component IIA